jgi:hypothetical protein
VRAVPDPQPLSAVTETFPELEPKVTVIYRRDLNTAVIRGAGRTLQV